MDPQLAEQHEPALPSVPRFSLRALLIVLALVSALFDIMSNVGLFWSALLVWSLLLVSAHVLGNLWGSHAYDSRGLPRDDSEQQAAAPRPAPIHPNEIRLRHQVNGGWARLVGIICGAIALGAAGGTFLTVFYWYQSNAAGIVVWYVSCGIVGALAGFVASGFLQVFTIATPPANPPAGAGG